MPWLYGPTAAGAPGGRDGSVGSCRRLLLGWLGDDASWRVDERLGVAWRARASRRAGRPDRGRPRRPPPPPKHRAPRGSGPEPDRPSGRPRTPVEGPPERHEPGQDRGRRGQQVVGRRSRTPARATRSAADSPERSSSARWTDDIRTDPSPTPARARRTRRRRRASRPGPRASRAGRRASRAGRAAARPARRDPRRGPARRPRRTARPSRAGPRRAGARPGSSSAPHASSAPSMVAAASDDPPASPAATGIRFSRRAASAGAGPGPAGPATADRRARGRQRPEHDVVGRRAGIEARRRGGCRRGRRPARGSADRRGASGTKTECRSWKPSGRRPTTARVRLSLAGASRTHRRQASDGSVAAITSAALAPGPPVGADRAERLAQGQPLPHREGLRAPLGVDADRRRGPRSPAPASNGSWRARTLWSILRRSRKLAWTSRQSSSSASGSRRSSASNGSTTMTADSTAGAGSNAVGRNVERDPDAGVVLHEDREVAHLPGRRRDPLRDLALDHQHQPLRAAAASQQRVQDRARDVVRQVRDDVVRRLDEPRRGPGRARRPR